MELLLNIELKKLEEPIGYRHRIMLMGSCFTEHIGNSLQNLKFNVLQNPSGILFGPESVCKSLDDYIGNRQYLEKDLFRLHDVWHSWQHHSRFSHTRPEEALRMINESHRSAHKFLKTADWLIITLGSSYSYRLTKNAELAAEQPGNGVANCHRAPADWFDKEMPETGDIISILGDCLGRLQQFNAKLKFLFTISPVRHARDGIVENNRSKARLIDSVHQLVNRSGSAYYFPAYELVIDVLRDYRFYDIDLVHPNYAATEFVLEKFTETCIDEDSRGLMQEVRKIITARKHRAFQPDTKAHREFLLSYFEKAKSLQQSHPFLNFEEEMDYFSRT